MFYMHHHHATDGLIPDEDGYDHDDEKHMRWEAMRAAREMIGFAAMEGRNALEDRFEVTDSDRRHLFTLKFADALDGSVLPRQYIKPT